MPSLTNSNNYVIMQKGHVPNNGKLCSGSTQDFDSCRVSSILTFPAKGVSFSLTDPPFFYVDSSE